VAGLGIPARRQGSHFEPGTLASLRMVAAHPAPFRLCRRARVLFHCAPGPPRRQGSLRAVTFPPPAVPSPYHAHLIRSSGVRSAFHLAGGSPPASWGGVVGARGGRLSCCRVLSCGSALLGVRHVSWCSSGGVVAGRRRFWAGGGCGAVAAAAVGGCLLRLRAGGRLRVFRAGGSVRSVAVAVRVRVSGGARVWAVSVPVSAPVGAGGGGSAAGPVVWWAVPR
jgi:hypothetical protein